MNVPKENPSDAVLKRAQAISQSYQFILKPDGKGGFMGNAVELPFVLGKGQSAQECLESVEKEVTHVVASILRRKEMPPTAGGCRRNAQINVRVLPEEKQTFDTIARQEGFRSTSDFLRKLALEYVRRTGVSH